MLYLNHSRQNCLELVSENQTVRNSNMLDQNVESAIIKMAQKIDTHHEVERNKQEQENRNKVNYAYLRSLGIDPNFRI